MVRILLECILVASVFGGHICVRTDLSVDSEESDGRQEDRDDASELLNVLDVRVWVVPAVTNLVKQSEKLGQDVWMRQ